MNGWFLAARNYPLNPGDTAFLTSFFVFVVRWSVHPCTSNFRDNWHQCNDQKPNNSCWEPWWDTKCSGLVTTWTTSRRTRWRRPPTSTTFSPCRSTSSPLASSSWYGHQHFRNLFPQKDLETKNPYLVKRLSGTGGLVFYQVSCRVGCWYFDLVIIKQWRIQIRMKWW